MRRSIAWISSPGRIGFNQISCRSAAARGIWNAYPVRIAALILRSAASSSDGYPLPIRESPIGDDQPVAIVHKPLQPLRDGAGEIDGVSGSAEDMHQQIGGVPIILDVNDLYRFLTVLRITEHYDQIVR